MPINTNSNLMVQQIAQTATAASPVPAQTTATREDLRLFLDTLQPTEKVSDSVATTDSNGPASANFYSDWQTNSSLEQDANATMFVQSFLETFNQLRATSAAAGEKCKAIFEKCGSEPLNSVALTEAQMFITEHNFTITLTSNLASQLNNGLQKLLSNQ
jgi:type IV pilus biogenesis protein CpaD/CtpE